MLLIMMVSMKSGLDGRNNSGGRPNGKRLNEVSMKSGLDGRNNAVFAAQHVDVAWVSQ